METTKKVYLANLKSFGNFGSIKGRFYMDKIEEHIQTDDKGRKYIPFIVNVNKEPDQYGNTHSVVLDTWKPDDTKAPVQKNDLPF